MLQLFYNLFSHSESKIQVLKKSISQFLDFKMRNLAAQIWGTKFSIYFYGAAEIWSSKAGDLKFRLNLQEWGGDDDSLASQTNISQLHYAPLVTWHQCRKFVGFFFMLVAFIAALTINVANVKWPWFVVPNDHTVVMLRLYVSDSNNSEVTSFSLYPVEFGLLNLSKINTKIYTLNSVQCIWASEFGISDWSNLDLTFGFLVCECLWIIESLKQLLKYYTTTESICAAANNLYSYQLQCLKGFSFTLATRWWWHCTNLLHDTWGKKLHLNHLFSF